MLDDALQRHSLPPGGTLQSVEVDGAHLRVRRWDGVRPDSGTIVLLNGRGDFIEKYAEACHAMAGWGPTLMTLDWRGQGLSGRLAADPRVGHARDLGVLAGDLPHLLDRLALPRPVRIVAHSMGGHLALRLLHDHPALIARAVLLSPMLRFRTAPLSWELARWIASCAVSLGLSESFAPGQGPFHTAERTRGARYLTADPARQTDESWWAAANPALVSGGVSFGWLQAAFRSVALLETSGYLEAIQTPILILASGADRIVDLAATRAASARLPGATLQVIPEAQHELLREVDALRTPTLARIQNFLLAPTAP